MTVAALELSFGGGQRQGPKDRRHRGREPTDVRWLDIDSEGF